MKDGGGGEEQNEKVFSVVGNDRGYKNYLRPYSDCRDGFSYDDMLGYLNKKIESGWNYVGNISESFDSIVKDLLEKD